ncbi:MAG: hypothetical protein VCB78_09050 [Myxococcota bacterium]|jgi:hypothetical protein
MAEVSAGEQIDLVSIPSPHWLWIGVGTLVGAVALTILPERVWGTYVGGRDPGAGAGGC